MNVVNGLTDAPAQVVGIPLEDGSRVVLTLNFRPQMNGWFFDLQWPGVLTPFTVRNRRLVVAGNLLRQYREIIPFGIAVFSVDNGDPMTQNCLADGTVTVVLLSASDVTDVEARVYAAP